MKSFYILGMLPAILITVAYILQAYSTLKLNQHKVWSVSTYMKLLKGAILWVADAIYMGDIPVMFANAFTAMKRRYFISESNFTK